MIEVQDLVKRYGGRCAVDHLSFTVEDGQIFGLLGPNGAGKSTTMNMMTGYLAVTEGRVVIQGHDVLEDPEAARRCVGYLPEVPPVYPEMTAGEYLLFAAELKKIPAGEREEQVEKVLSLTGTEEARDRLVRNLSKGYRQRLGLAQAILGFPPVIILDEPTVGLDPKQVVEIRQLIRNLGRNHTVLLSSHILSEIRAVCDKVLILRKGKAVACDTPEALEASLSQDHGLELQCRGGGKEARTLALSIPGVTGCTVTGEAGAPPLWPWRRTGTSGRTCSAPSPGRGCRCWSCAPAPPLWRTSFWISPTTTMPWPPGRRHCWGARPRSRRKRRGSGHESHL